MSQKACRHTTNDNKTKNKKANSLDSAIDISIRVPQNYQQQQNKIPKSEKPGLGSKYPNKGAATLPTTAKKKKSAKHGSFRKYPNKDPETRPTTKKKYPKFRLHAEQDQIQTDSNYINIFAF